MITTIEPRSFIIVSSYKQENSLLAHKLNKLRCFYCSSCYLSTLILVKYFKLFSKQSLKLLTEEFTGISTCNCTLDCNNSGDDVSTTKLTVVYHIMPKITWKVTHKYDYTQIFQTMYTATNIIRTYYDIALDIPYMYEGIQSTYHVTVYTHM